MILEVKNIHKSFEDKEVLHGISFSVQSGKALGLLGRNGAGKTTTIRILMNVFKANDGEILIDGKPFVQKDYQIGYLPEERGLYPKKKISEQLIYLAQLRGLSKKEAKENMKKWLMRLNVSEYENKYLETLSKGNQQKIQLVQALISNPDIVILDEPFSGLDPVNSQILKDVIKEVINDNKIVIFSSHQMSYVEEFCEDIAIIDEGNIVLSGELKTVKKKYGENRIILNSSNFKIDELKEICENDFSDFVVVNEVRDEFILLEIKEASSKKEFLSALSSSSIDVSLFGDYEPSLNDIFVSKVGGKDE